MHPLKKSTSKSMTKWWKINENLRGWVPLEPCWRKMTERIDFSLIFGTILGYQNERKIDEKMKWFADALKTVFSAQEGPKGSKMEVQNPSKIKLFLESNKTRESCSRPHAELVFKVWRTPKPYFSRTIFVSPLHAALEPSFLRFLLKMIPQRMSRILQNSF